MRTVSLAAFGVALSQISSPRGWIVGPQAAELAVERHSRIFRGNPGFLQSWRSSGIHNFLAEIRHFSERWGNRVVWRNRGAGDG